MPQKGVIFLKTYDETLTHGKAVLNKTSLEIQLLAKPDDLDFHANSFHKPQNLINTVWKHFQITSILLIYSTKGKANATVSMDSN